MSITSSKKSNTSHYLGIDFGEAKIGLAIADSETKIAFGYGTLKNDKDLFRKLAEIVEKEGIEKVIIGITGVETRFIASGNSGDVINGVSTGRNSGVQNFAKKLLRYVETHGVRLRKAGDAFNASLRPIKIEFQSEIFSTQMAERNLKEKGAKKIKRFDDQEAARIILQSWLDKKI